MLPLFPGTAKRQWGSVLQTLILFPSIPDAGRTATILMPLAIHFKTPQEGSFRPFSQNQIKILFRTYFLTRKTYSRNLAGHGRYDSGFHQEGNPYQLC